MNQIIYTYGQKDTSGSGYGSGWSSGGGDGWGVGVSSGSIKGCKIYII